MKVIIIEDEPTAVKKLEDILHGISREIMVLACLPSVREAVDWIRRNPAPDLGFFDIQLSDDLSFRIFEECPVNFPVVFTTAYDHYLLRAFEYHSVHYLLKPLQEEKVMRAIQKVRDFKSMLLNHSIHHLLQAQKNGGHPSNRFVVRKGNDFIPLEIEHIAFFSTEHGLSFVHTLKGETFIIDQSLSEIEKQLDQRTFFRANRQYLVHLKAIRKFKSIEQSKIKLEILTGDQKEITIGKQNAILFRQWISGNG